MTAQLSKEYAYRAACLEFYNRTLLEKGIIDQSTYRRMLIAIREKYHIVKGSTDNSPLNECQLS